VPGLYALRATRLIFEDQDARARVLVLAALGSDEEVLAAVRAGAHGVLPRDGTPRDLRRAVRVVAAGGAVLTSQVTRRLAGDAMPGGAGDGIVPPALAALTRREREVLALVARGFGNAEIAARLAVSPATVKTHVGSAVAKLDARDRAELVTLAYETGFVVPAG
jgi:DNA-binding NarL/FixJ family response regulator